MSPTVVGVVSPTVVGVVSASVVGVVSATVVGVVSSMVVGVVSATVVGVVSGSGLAIGGVVVKSVVIVVVMEVPLQSAEPAGTQIELGKSKCWPSGHFNSYFSPK